jgi:hypothetical protein
MKEVQKLLQEIIDICQKDGIHQWHEQSEGDFVGAECRPTTHKADYYVNVSWIFKIEKIAKKAEKLLNTSNLPQRHINTIKELESEIAHLKYKYLPKDQKPRCQAKVYIGGGKVRQCDRSAELGKKYCYSHRNWDDEQN